jgi:mannose-6-phosphate isomerase-like protein (cupin superfamily)
MQKICLDEKIALFDEHWRPKTVATLNRQEVKIVKVKGEFPWHHHAHQDEFFMVWKGTIWVEFRDRVATLGPGECVVVPRSVPRIVRLFPKHGSARRVTRYSAGYTIYVRHQAELNS